MLLPWPLLTFLGAASASLHRWPRGATVSRAGSESAALPDASNCTTYYFEQHLDHYSFAGNSSFLQRYLVYDRYWTPGGPIFFYAGNEADVTLYVNNTGLMWESAEEFGALLLFAEHRYWGESCPFVGATCGDDMAADNPNAVHKEYLTYEQVMMDFVRLLAAFKAERKVDDAPVIAFGGSYGAMLAFWLRATYPHVFAGAIAASAPLRVFAGWQRPSADWDSHSYWQVVTRGANATGGSAPRCSRNVRHAFDALLSFGESSDGRAKLAHLFGTCSTTPLQTPADVRRLYKLMVFTFDTLSMGNYPYASNYLTGGKAMLPPFPLRHACESLAPEFGEAQQDALLGALSAATQVVTNASGRETCIPLPTADADDGQDCVLCDYFSCTNANPLETTYARDGLVDDGGDMFLPEGDPASGVLGGVNVSAIEERCARLYSTAPRWHRMVEVYGGVRRIASITNVVYSNGFLDQWSSAGITWVARDDSTSIMIDNAAHHLDLMFSHPDDPPSVVAARETERAFMRRWVAQWEANASPERH